ncbi:MAG: hypothetical protein WDA16_05315 [Candidatus Thermoplasmatota archaeon]
MPTTVRVEDEVKRGLDRLQGLVQAETGERLTHSALLARLLRVARLHEADLYASEAPRQRIDLVRRRLDKLAIHGAHTDVRTLDETLYGERP